MKSQLIKNELLLDQNVKISSKIVENLAIHQMNGCRFLYRNYKKNQGCILNDESGLGKCYQTTSFLSGVIKKGKRCLIICRSDDRIHHWMYHFNILTNLSTAIVNQADINLQEQEVYLVTVANSLLFEVTLSIVGWDIVVLDETGENLLKLKELEQFGNINCKRKIVLATTNLMNNNLHLFKLLNYCSIKQLNSPIFTDIQQEIAEKEDICLKDRRKILNLCRDFFLRRYRSQYLQNLPLVADQIFNQKFRTWKHENIMMQIDDEAENESETEYVSDTVPVSRQISEPLFDFADVMTQNMSPLLFETSDFDANKNIVDDTRISIEETPNDEDDDQSTQMSSQGYGAFGQDVSCSSNSSTQTLVPCTPSIFNPEMVYSSKYDFSLDTIMKNSTQKSVSSTSDIEIVQEKNAFIIISSSSNDAEIKKRESDNFVNEIMRISPNLFDDDTFEDMSRTKSPTLDSPFIPKPKKKNNSAPKYPLPYFSTPLAKLIKGNNSQTSEEEASSADIFEDTSSKDDSSDKSKAKKENIFEITKNEAFANVIRINSDTEMSPIKDYQMNKSTEKRTPKSASKIQLKTPSTTSSRASASPRNGWLSKHNATNEDSSDSTNTTPRKSQKRRKKLESWFQDADLVKTPTKISPHKRLRTQSERYARIIIPPSGDSGSDF